MNRLQRDQILHYVGHSFSQTQKRPAAFLRHAKLSAAESMTDSDVQPSSSPAAGPQHDEAVLLQEDASGEKEPPDSAQRGAGESLSLLADVALAPPCGDCAACSCDCGACGCLEVVGVEGGLQSMQLQLQFLMSRADDLHHALVSGRGHLESEALAAAVPSFLYTCQPYFNHLESTIRSSLSRHSPLPFDIYTRRLQLFDFSQQLCDRLEQLVLTYASYSLLCLDESEPNSVSHFCVGQSQLDRLRLTAFLYCKPTPYLARVDTGLHKRMRWNVERLRDDEQQQMNKEQGGEKDDGGAGIVSDTEFYFLCYEDIPNTHAEVDGDGEGSPYGNVVRMWSIGQWVQVNPDPDTEDIYDWIMCEVPQANYHRLLFLGSSEPSICSATDYLQQLLLSHQTTE